MHKKTAELVKKARDHAGLTQKQLAQKLYVNANTVAGWEQGRHQPGIEDLATIAGVCGVSIQFLPDEAVGGRWEVHPQHYYTNMCSVAGDTLGKGGPQ